MSLEDIMEALSYELEDPGMLAWCMAMEMLKIKQVFLHPGPQKINLKKKKIC